MRLLKYFKFIRSSGYVKLDKQLNWIILHEVNWNLSVISWWMYFITDIIQRNGSEFLRRSQLDQGHHALMKKMIIDHVQWNREGSHQQVCRPFFPAVKTKMGIPELLCRAAFFWMLWPLLPLNAQQLMWTTIYVDGNSKLTSMGS